jgi:hypothetical protein
MSRRATEIETSPMPPGDAAPMETVPILLPWPPRSFDFDTPILRASNVHFERNADAETSLIRRIGRVRIVVDFDRLHTFAPVAHGSRDFHLLNLVPDALRFVERVEPFDALPPQLWSDDPPPAPEAYLRTATARLLRVLAAHVERSDRAQRSLPLARSDHRRIFERAALQQADTAPDGLHPLARQLQHLANAHAGVLAAFAEQPDYPAMAQRIDHLRRRLGVNHHCPDVLLSQALQALLAQIEKPGQTATRLLQQAEADIWHPMALHDLPGVIHRQRVREARLRDLALFWHRSCREWLSERVERPNWRHIELLARSTQRRLAAPLYDEEDDAFED